MSAVTRAQGAIGTMAVFASLNLLLAPPAHAKWPPPSSVGTSGQKITVTATDNGSQQPQGESPGADGAGVAPPSVPAPCWMSPTMTGKQYYEFVQFFGAVRGAIDGGSGLLPGFELHKDDDKGWWYSMECNRASWPDPNDIAGFVKFQDQFWIDNPPVWVPANQTPPQMRVRPELLREIAIKSLFLPKPILSWNPKRTGNQGTLVNLATWFWLDNAPRPLTVSARAGTTEASVTATLGGIEISAQGEEPVSCTGPGTPYTAGASTTCSLAFSRASSALGMQSTPVTVKATWTATWAAGGVDQGPITPQPAPVIGIEDIRVDEVQTLVTGAR